MDRLLPTHRRPGLSHTGTYSASVNCSSSVRWMIEKLSSEISVSTSVAVGCAMHRQPLHVVDLEAHVGLDQHRAIDRRAGLHLGERNAADAHADAGQPRIAALEHQQVAGRRDCAVADVELADALDGKFAGARTAEQEALDVAVLIEAALGDRDQTCRRAAACAARSRGTRAPCCWAAAGCRAAPRSAGRARATHACRCRSARCD